MLLLQKRNCAKASAHDSVTSFVTPQTQYHTILSFNISEFVCKIYTVTEHKSHADFKTVHGSQTCNFPFRCLQNESARTEQNNT